MRIEKVTFWHILIVALVAAVAVAVVAVALREFFGYQISGVTYGVAIGVPVAQMAMRWHRERKPAK